MDIFEEAFGEVKEEYQEKALDKPFGIKHLEGIMLTSNENLPFLFVNYKKEIKKIISVVIQSGKPNACKKIAIIGPSGMGKTDLCKLIIEKISSHKYESEFRDFQYSFLWGAKLAGEDILAQRLNFFRKSDKPGMVMLDDFHEIFFDKKDIEKAAMKLLNSFTSGTVITTWTPYGWSHALSKDKRISDLFDEKIFLKGLNVADAREMLVKRMSYLIDNKPGGTYPFSEDALKFILKLYDRNPAIILIIAKVSIERAYKRKHKEVSRGDVKSALDVLDFTPKIVQQHNKLDRKLKEILLVSMAKTTLKIEDYINLLDRDRTTILPYLNELENKGLVRIDKNKKTSLYMVNPVVRNQIESKIIEDAEITQKIR